MIDSSHLWALCQDDELESPVGTGIRQAVGQAFPLDANDVLTERMKAALRALADLESVLPADRQLGSAR